MMYLDCPPLKNGDSITTYGFPIRWMVTFADGTKLSGECIEESELIRRYVLLRDAVRKHRSQKADDRCIDDDKAIYAALEDGIEADFHVGDKTEMLLNCARFIEKRCLGGKWPNYADLESVVQGLLELNRENNPFTSIAVANLQERARHLYEKASQELTNWASDNSKYGPTPRVTVAKSYYERVR